MQLLFLLASVFRMVVLPVQFEDRELGSTRAKQEAMVQQAERYFNRQYADSGTSFDFELAPAVTLSHPVAWYGDNYPDRKDTRIAEAVREACLQLQDQVNFAAYDNNGDGVVDNVFLLFAAPGEQDSGLESDLYPQQGRLSASGGAFSVSGSTVDRYAAAPEKELGIFCHEFGHVLGLPDFYDTDGEESGGTARGLWGTSLMDEGCRAAAPPDFGALEYELLGLGTCEPLETGAYQLSPLSKGRRYLKAATDREDEFFLFEARGDGLYVYHIDRSDNAAGSSARLGIDLTARERWDAGEINNNPEHPCARLLPADPAATDATGLPFPGGGSDSFGSDTPAAFRSWSGASSGLALTNIRADGEGGVSFTVLQPLELRDLSVYQDAAVIRWNASSALEGIQGYTLSWSDGETDCSCELPADAVSCTLNGLTPKTSYTFSVQLRCSDTERYSVDGFFSTKVLREGTFPYIYLSETTRNLDGSFPSGSKLPLRVFNASGVEKVQWSLDDIPIVPEADGRYTLQRGGTLRARILYTDGTSETLLKEIIVQ